MRNVRVDQFEFDNRGSEESLEIDVAARSRFPHPTLTSFANAVLDAPLAASLPEPLPFFRLTGRDQICAYLLRFASIDVPYHADYPSYLLSGHEFDEFHLLISGPDTFIRYRWSTSA